MKTALLIIACMGIGLVIVVAILRRVLTPGHAMRAYARDAVDLARRNFQIELDFSENSIAKIEAIAARQWQEAVAGTTPKADVLETFAKVWGAYLGEVMRRHHGGEWTVSRDGPMRNVYVLEINGGQLSPPAKVYGRLTNGDEDNLEIYYQVVTRDWIARASERRTSGDA